MKRTKILQVTNSLEYCSFLYHMYSTLETCEESYQLDVPCFHYQTQPWALLMKRFEAIIV